MQVERNHSAAVFDRGEPPARPGLFGQCTNDLAPLLGGTAESDCLVLVGIGGAVFGVSASRTGEWALDTACAVPLSGRFDLGPDGMKTLRITCINAAGDTREIRGDFTLKTCLPVTPTLETATVGFARPVFGGRAEAGSELRLRVGGATFLALVDADGGWQVDTGATAPSAGLLDLGGPGRKKAGLVSCDPAGNTSEAEQFFRFESQLVRAAEMPDLVPDARLNPLGFELRSGLASGQRHWWPFQGMKRSRHQAEGAGR